MRIPLSASVFVALMITAGALVLGVALEALLLRSSSPAWLVLVGLAAVTGACTIKLPGIETRFSLSDALVFTSVLLLGPSCAAVAAAVDAFAASLRFNKRDELFLSRTAFNVAAAAVSIWVPAQAFAALAGLPAPGAAGPNVAYLALPLFVLVGGYSLLNTGAIAAVLALTARMKVVTVWRENFAWLWVAHAWSGLVAGALAIAVPHVNVLSTFVIVAVGLVGYATVRVYVGKVEESTDRLHKLNDLYLATIHALAMAIDAKDQVTHGHIRRVQVYAVGLARALGVTDDATLKGIEAGALLHDTGKIAVPEHILNKPGKLSPQEYERMKTHVTIGADILSGINFPFPVIPLVRHHHENWNGTGYPGGLAGEAIPLGARILSVVDCFDALTSDRPYRRALTVDAALDILRERSGTMYDPRVVEKFIEVYPRLTATLAAEDTPAAGASEMVPQAAVSAAPDLAERFPSASLPLSDLARLAALGLSPQEVALVLLHRLQGSVRFATAVVYVPTGDTDSLEVLFATGGDADVFRRSTVRLTEGLSGWVAAHNQTVVNGNPVLDLHGAVSATRIELASALVVPYSDTQGRGAIALYAAEPDAFTLDDARVLREAAACLSRARGAVRTKVAKRSKAA